MASSKPNKEFKRVLHELELEQQRLRETRNQLQIRNNQLDAAEKRCADLERQVSLSSTEDQAQPGKVPPEIQYVVLEKHLIESKIAEVPMGKNCKVQGSCLNHEKLSKEHHELKQKYDHQVMERNDMAAKWSTRAPSLEIQQLFDALEQKVAKVESIGESKDKMIIQKTQRYDRLEQTHVEMILHHKYERQQWERTKFDLEKTIILDVERYKRLREASCAMVKAQAEHMEILRADLAIQMSLSETKSALSKT